jgi:P4 family phage/plasmid primase-like protien
MNIEVINRLTAEQMKGLPETRIPPTLQRPEFRFVKLIMWDKKAFEPGWTKTTNYTFDSEDLKNWMAKGGNYGISTGVGGLLVIDIDNESRMKEIGLLEKLPATYMIRTRSGGLHYYYICRDFDKKRIMYDLVQTEKVIGAGGKELTVYRHLGEMQWQGQQVVGPSSRFRIIEEPEVVRIQIWKEEKVPSDPIREVSAAEILGIFEGKVRYNKKLEAAVTEEEDVAGMEKAKKTRVGKITKKSTRFGPLKIGWLDKIKISDIALPNPITKSDPNGSGEIQGGHPLHGSDSEANFSVNVQKNIWHCFRDDSGGGVLELVAVMNGLIECGEAMPGCLRKDGVLARVIELLITKYNMNPADIPFELRDGKAGDVKISKVRRIVESVAEYFHIITLSHSEKSLIYDGGVYKEASNLMLKGLFLALGANTNNLRAECLEMLKASTVVEEDDIDSDPFTICVENGLLNINSETWEITLLPHDPNYLNLIKLPVSYLPEQTCDKIQGFIGDITDGAGDALLIEELFGYLIFKRHFIHKAFLFIGAGRNGKSTLLGVMRNFIGESNVTSIPIQKLEDRFTPSELYGKLANISGDISSEALKHTERFKEITGEDFLLMEKKFQQPFYMVNVAKQIFTGNQAPGTGDGSYGFYSRFIILNFPKQFDFEPGATKSPNTNLLTELSSPEEMSGLLNLALARLKDLVKNKQFTGALSVAETSQIFEELSNPENIISQFYIESLVPQPTNFISTIELNEAFQEWVKEHQYKPIYINVFLKMLKKLYHLKDMRKMVEGHYITVIMGITFKGESKRQ